MARGDKGRERRERRERERESAVASQVVRQVTGRNRSESRSDSRFSTERRGPQVLTRNHGEPDSGVNWFGLIFLVAAFFIGSIRLILINVNVLPFSGWAFVSAISVVAMAIYWLVDDLSKPVRSVLLTMYVVCIVTPYTVVGPTPAVLYPHGNSDQARNESGITVYNPFTTHVEVFDNVIDVEYEGETYACSFDGDGLALFEEWGTSAWQKKDVRETVRELLGEHRPDPTSQPVDSFSVEVLNERLRHHWSSFISIRPKKQSISMFP